MFLSGVQVVDGRQGESLVLSDGGQGESMVPPCPLKHAEACLYHEGQGESLVRKPGGIAWCLVHAEASQSLKVELGLRVFGFRV